MKLISSFFGWIFQGIKRLVRNTVLGVSVILLALLVSAAFLYISTFTRILDYGSFDGLLSFIGGLTGGIFALLGVYFTIQSENEKYRKDEQRKEKDRKEEFKLIYKPIISIEFKEEKEFSYLFEIKNIGRAEGMNISIVALINKNKIALRNNFHTIIPSGMSYELEVIKYYSQDDVSNGLVIEISATYSDIFNNCYEIKQPFEQQIVYSNKLKKNPAIYTEK